jgi:hypothetical protein
VAQLNWRTRDLLKYHKLFAPQVRSSDFVTATTRYVFWTISFDSQLDAELEQFRAALTTLQPTSNQWDDVRAKYKQSCIKYHPDMTSKIEDSKEREKATELFRQISTAYEYLEKQMKAQKYARLLDKLNLENATNLQS